MRGAQAFESAIYSGRTETREAIKDEKDKKGRKRAPVGQSRGRGGYYTSRCRLKVNIRRSWTPIFCDRPNVMGIVERVAVSRSGDSATARHRYHRCAVFRLSGLAIATTQPPFVSITSPKRATAYPVGREFSLIDVDDQNGSAGTTPRYASDISRERWHSLGLANGHVFPAANAVPCNLAT